MLLLSGWDSVSRSSHLLSQRAILQILSVNGADCLVLLLHKAPKNRLCSWKKNTCMIGRVCVSLVCYLFAFLKKKKSQSKFKKIKGFKKV